MSDIAETTKFFQKAYPVSLPKNFRTQLGVHVEEFTEMLDQLDYTDEQDRVLMHYINEALKGAATHLKKYDGEVRIKDRVEFLDSLADQIVTATGCGYHAKMDVAAAIAEVNRSNASKFGEDGEPILDINLKMTKGPNYSKPDLKSFV